MCLSTYLKDAQQQVPVWLRMAEVIPSLILGETSNHLRPADCISPYLVYGQVLEIIIFNWLREILYWRRLVDVCMHFSAKHMICAVHCTLGRLSMCSGRVILWGLPHSVLPEWNMALMMTVRCLVQVTDLSQWWRPGSSSGTLCSLCLVFPMPAITDPSYVTQVIEKDWQAWYSEGCGKYMWRWTRYCHVHSIKCVLIHCCHSASQRPRLFIHFRFTCASSSALEGSSAHVSQGRLCCYLAGPIHFTCLWGIQKCWSDSARSPEQFLVMQPTYPKAL